MATEQPNIKKIQDELGKKFIILKCKELVSNVEENEIKKEIEMISQQMKASGVTESLPTFRYDCIAIYISSMYKSYKQFLNKSIYNISTLQAMLDNVTSNEMYNAYLCTLNTTFNDTDIQTYKASVGINGLMLYTPLCHNCDTNKNRLKLARMEIYRALAYIIRFKEIIKAISEVLETEEISIIFFPILEESLLSVKQFTAHYNETLKVVEETIKNYQLNEIANIYKEEKLNVLKNIFVPFDIDITQIDKEKLDITKNELKKLLSGDIDTSSNEEVTKNANKLYDPLTFDTSLIK